MMKFILKYALVFAIVWTLVIFGLCSTPGKYVPSAHWLDLLSFDKLVHAGMFFILASLWFACFITNKRINPTVISLILVACIAYGGLLEIMQATMFSQRSGDWFDFIANSTGCLLALLLFKKKKWFSL